ncbi:MAG TPA: hypothetical protein VKT77_19415 [Chthonomonadaceae bacterium]|nr:hypothetical protein [Chthonomonadaceae bacterium]
MDSSRIRSAAVLAGFGVLTVWAAISTWPGAPGGPVAAVRKPGNGAATNGRDNMPGAPVRGARPPLSAYLFGGSPDCVGAPVGRPAEDSTPGASAPAPDDPFADLAYTGSVTLEGRTLALLENRKTHEGWFVAAGGVWQSFDVGAITADSITLTGNGTSRTLARSTDIGVVPLSADAAGFREAVAAADARDNPPPISEAQMQAGSIYEKELTNVDRLSAELDNVTNEAQIVLTLDALEGTSILDGGAGRFRVPSNSIDLSAQASGLQVEIRDELKPGNL